MRRVSSEIVAPCFRAPSTSETVACETPASRATSACRGRDVRPAGAGARPGLARFLDGLDAEVAAAGGRVCLAQDSRTRAETAAAMYPRLGAFRELRAELDPTDAFRSDLARRLGL